MPLSLARSSCPGGGDKAKLEASVKPKPTEDCKDTKCRFLVEVLHRRGQPELRCILVRGKTCPRAPKKGNSGGE